MSEKQWSDTERGKEVRPHITQARPVPLKFQNSTFVGGGLVRFGLYEYPYVTHVCRHVHGVEFGRVKAEVVIKCLLYTFFLKCIYYVQCSAWRPEKGTKITLQMVVSHHVVAGN